MSKFHIVYAKNHSLAVVEICEGMEYELSDYHVASQYSFDIRDDAEKHASEIAKKNGYTYHGSSNQNYLD